MRKIPMSLSWKSLRLNSATGNRVEVLSEPICMSVFRFFSNDRMSTIFSSASSTFKCMANFGLTQWILGASSAVFPGALPTIDDQQAAILAWLKEARSNIWLKGVFAILGSISPELSRFLSSSNPDLSGSYQALGASGWLTANVSSLFRHD